MNLLLPKETPEERIQRVTKAYWLPTQAAWINDRSRMKLMAKCRRFGGSYCEAYSTVEDTAMTGQIFDAWVGSRDLLAARLFVGDCKKFARQFDAAARDNGEVLLDSGERDLRAFELELGNDRSIRALSSSPDAFAGKQGRFRLDEFALHKDPRQLYSIVQPALIRGGSLGIISTHRGSQNFFNELVKEVKEKGNKKRISYHEINIESAVQEGLWIKIQQTLKAARVEDERLGWSDDDFLQSLRDECATEEAWKQEFMCQPCDDNSALLTWEELLAASLNQADMQKLLAEVPETAPRYLGLDIGRHNHPSVLWQWVKWRGLMITEKILPMHKLPFAQQEKIFFAHLSNAAVVNACVDATGLGMQLAENSVAEYPGKVLPITFNAKIKLEMAVKAKRAFQDRIVRIQDEAKVQYELYSIKQRSGSGDSIVITSEAGVLDGHADYAWAAFLGMHAAETGGGPVQSQSIPKGDRERSLFGSPFGRLGRVFGLG
ncbi:terminase family protein [Prosthecobacter algae]|uniref:Terminase family protein n=1 Tax=Prosthecobacter algae TaxID=1144682 RepID=A0ABP9P1V7_9BACT